MSLGFQGKTRCFWSADGIDLAWKIQMNLDIEDWEVGVTRNWFTEAL